MTVKSWDIKVQTEFEGRIGAHEILPFDDVISVVKMPRIALVCKARQGRREPILVHFTPIQVLCNVIEGGVRSRVGLVPTRKVKLHGPFHFKELKFLLSEELG